MFSKASLALVGTSCLGHMRLLYKLDVYHHAKISFDLPITSLLYS